MKQTWLQGRLHTGLQKKNKKPARSLNSSVLNTNDVFSLNDFKLGDFVDRIYPIELEIKYTTDTARSVSYLDLPLDLDNECLLRTKSYDKSELSS
jgi:hypothetical protein